MAEPPAKQSVLKSFTHGIVKTTSIIGGLYVVRGYMRDRLEDVRVKMEEEERSKDILRTRFLQTQEDTSYTILALMPTLSTQVLQNMDVDALTRELQARSRARTSRHIESARVAQIQEAAVTNSTNTNANINPTANPRPPSSLSSSVNVVSPALVYPPNPYPATVTLPNPYQHQNSTLQEQDADTRSDIDSLTHSHSSASELGLEDLQSPSTTTGTGISSSFISESGSVTRSWVVESSSSASAAGKGSAQERSRSPAVSAASSMENSNSETSSAVGDERMSESVISITTNTTNTSAESENLNGTDTRTKAELWNEVKMLTFTRTLTTLYSTTLLCLFTTLQLTLLARGKYVSFVLAQEKEERKRDKMQAEMPSVAGLLLGAFVPLQFGGGSGLWGGQGQGQGTLERLLSGLNEEDEADDEEADGFGFGQQQQRQRDEEDGWGFGWGAGSHTEKGYGGKGKGRAEPLTRRTPGQGQVPSNPWTGEIGEDLENKYLTMSWWLLHVGWKDVGERVRRGVEEVFDGVSLKTKLAAVDLHRLVGDVRRRVEHEITFEGHEKRTNFLSSLLPPTPETIHHVLTQGGYTASSSSASAYYDVGLGYDVGNTQSIRPPQIQLQPPQEHELHTPLKEKQKEKEKQHEQVPSDSSTSLESSQLSYNFVSSPALGVSVRVDPRPRRSQLHQTQNHAQPYAGPSQPHSQYSTQAHTQAQTQYLTPHPPQSPSSHLLDAPFLALLEETRTILASPDFGRVLEVCLDTATEVLFEGLERNVFGRDGGPGDEGHSHGAEETERIRLAGLLPGLARWSQLALDGLPNELIDKILNMREVSCLSAIAFARFEERFASC